MPLVGTGETGLWAHMSILVFGLSFLTTSLVFILRAEEAIRMTGRISRWSLAMSGVDPSSARFLHTALHRRLLGDPETALDRMIETPGELRSLIIAMRIGGFVYLGVGTALMLAALTLALPVKGY